MAVLGESVEQLEPPPELRERVLAIVREEAEAKQAELMARGGQEASRAARAPWLARAAAAAGGGSGGARDRRALVSAATWSAGNGGGGGGAETVPVVAQQGIGGTLAVGDTLLDARPARPRTS